MKKLIVDFLPLLVFFIAYKLSDIYIATGAAIAATLLQIIYLKWSKTPVEPMHWLGAIIVVVFGGLTIWLHDETFIKWKPTVLYWSFAVILLGGLLFKGKNLLQSLLGKQLELPAKAWNTLAFMWIAFFAFMGALNLYIAFSFTLDQWVSFKVWWSLGLILVFSVIQGVYMSKFVDTVETKSTTEGNSVNKN